MLTELLTNVKTDYEMLIELLMNVKPTMKC
jgi:hypothetical protein